MELRLRNLAIAAAALPAAHVASWFCRQIWDSWFVDGESFSVYLGFFSDYDLLGWAFYFVFFLSFWGSASVFLRTAHPYSWAGSFGVVAFLAYEAATSRIVITSSEFSDVYAFLESAKVASATVFGCLAGVYVSQRVREMAPNYSLKRPHQSLRD